ncbi:hypothetical protein [Pseudonocardia acidicola]|uniref:DUF559 domain-containing protein n=1 Tax=Pseudonocardia acidicola TaxID=2724939 RepID=A0ABX1SET7_9PSEU|nr:hypothetical protein [Pseudonocardia acidicola]NMH99003.1 hypothetical protein [Pseudonocardia acidicola]
MLDGPFRGSDVLACGVLTPGVLRGPRFRRLFPDVYLRAGATVDLRTLSRAAFLFVERRGGVLNGYSAAELLGCSCGPVRTPAEVLVARHVKPQRGLRVTRGAAAPSELVDADGCRLTSPLRTAWDLARREPLVEAVVAVDALARRGAFAPKTLLQLRALQPGARGCRQLDRVVALADPGAESPMETRLRLLLVLAGLPAPVVQYRLFDEHGFVLARFDLAYPDALLAIEYDGDRHVDELDRRRDVRTGRHGWHTIRFGKGDLTRTPQTTLTAVRDIYRRRRALLAAPTAP